MGYKKYILFSLICFNLFDTLGFFGEKVEEAAKTLGDNGSGFRKGILKESRKYRIRMPMLPAEIVQSDCVVYR